MTAKEEAMKARVHEAVLKGISNGPRHTITAQKIEFFKGSVDDRNALRCLVDAIVTEVVAAEIAASK